MKQLSGNKDTTRVIGVMSGTSLDGLDIASCLFSKTHKGWHWKIEAAETIDYPADWREKLEGSHLLSGEDLTLLDTTYGTYIGEEVSGFISRHRLQADFISSHGHTVFHRPEKGFTLQIGHGTYIAVQANLPVIADYRTGDVALGGQGAPLVPIGDKLLFGEYAVCLNLGGFANISFDEKGIRKAGDICPVNIVLNTLAQKAGIPYDEDGRLGKSGTINHKLLKKLNNLPFYDLPFPRSLGREWVEDQILPLLAETPDSVANHLITIYEHITIQIAKYIKPGSKVLITGGGAYNQFLMEKIREKTGIATETPSEELIKYKEALIFAFMGVLRSRNEINCLKTVTGAKSDSSQGTLFLPAQYY